MLHCPLNIAVFLLVQAPLRTMVLPSRQGLEKPYTGWFPSSGHCEVPGSRGTSALPCALGIHSQALSWVCVKWQHLQCFAGPMCTQLHSLRPSNSDSTGGRAGNPQSTQVFSLERSSSPVTTQGDSRGSCKGQQSTSHETCC